MTCPPLFIQYICQFCIRKINAHSPIQIYDLFAIRNTQPGLVGDGS